MKPYADKTEVTVEKSKVQIERLLTEFKASSVMMASNSDKSMIVFAMANRHVKFVLPLPQKAEFARHRNPMAALEQATRTRWRALYLALRAKLEMAATGITTFEDEFMSHIVLPDGATVGESIREPIAAMYRSGKITPLLPDYSTESRDG